SYRRSIRSSCATAARSSSPNRRWPRGRPEGTRIVAGVVPRTGGGQAGRARGRRLRGGGARRPAAPQTGTRREPTFLWQGLGPARAVWPDFAYGRSVTTPDRAG